MIYFDNAATSFPKPRSVLREVQKCCKRYCGNPGRSGHRMSIRAAEAIYSVRESVCELIGINEPENVIFTQNATHALNIAIKGLIREKCHVIISDLEHNSVIRPLESLRKICGVEYSIFDHTNPGGIDGLRRADTKFLITTLRSNVIGVNVDYGYISEYCRQNGIRLILDASQYIGHTPLSLENIYFDALCAPGHKGLFGIQGSGILVLGKGAKPENFIEGGSGSNTFDLEMPSESPERYEAGTLSTPAIVSLGEGIRCIHKIGIENIDGRIQMLTNLLYDRLIDITNVRILGCSNGICAFNVGMLPSSHIADLLNQGGICVRGGFHCAPLTHRFLRTEEQGAVRISFSHFNGKREIDEFYKYLKSSIKLAYQNEK